MSMRSLLRLARAGCRPIHTTAVRGNKDLLPIIDDSELSKFGEPLLYTPAETPPTLPAFDTSVCDPTDHTPEQEALWYNIPDEEYKQYFADHHILSPQYRTLREVLGDGASFMIRKPAISVINYIKQIDVSTVTPPKFVFHGRDGVGKTTSLVHVAHYLAKNEFVLFQVPTVNRWIRQLLKNSAEIAPSTILPGKYDHIADAVSFLKLFLRQNKPLLTSLGLTLSSDYQLSTRESVKAGEPLSTLVELGISRAPLAAACVLILGRELRGAAKLGKCKVAVVVDEMNAIWSEDSVYKHEDAEGSAIKALEFTLVTAVREMLENDWHNGLVVGCVDVRVKTWAERGAGAVRHGFKPSHNQNDLNQLHRGPQMYLPRHLLGQSGWDTLDPFVPVPVPEYNMTEVRSVVHKMASVNWVSREQALTEDGINQLGFVTGRNAWHLNDYLSSL